MMSLSFHEFTFDHSPTLAEIREKLFWLRDAGVPKPGVVAMSKEDYLALAREVYGDPPLHFYNRG